MDLPQVTALIRDVGFPIFVALYVLMRIEPVLKQIAASLVRLEVLISKHEQPGGP